jgi:hypothetical protein
MPLDSVARRCISSVEPTAFCTWSTARGTTIQRPDKGEQHDVMERQSERAGETMPSERLDPRSHRCGEDEPEEHERDHEPELPQGERACADRDHDHRRERDAFRRFFHDQGFFAFSRMPQTPWSSTT